MDNTLEQIYKSALQWWTHSVDWQKMNKQQKIQYINSTKTKAAVMMMQANHFFQQGDFCKAKSLFTQIAQNCLQITQPDQQIQKWIQTSYSCLCLIHRKKQRDRNKLNQHISKQSSHKRQNVLVLQYNKFIGQFQLEDQEKQAIRSDTQKQIYQYVSKINMVLYNYQNVVNSHSLYFILSSYWMAFGLTLVSLILGIFFLSTTTVLQINFGSDSISIYIQILIVGSLLCIPLLLIFMKNYKQKDDNFFLATLRSKIQQINQDCKFKKNNLQFMMPQGRQINIWIGGKVNHQHLHHQKPSLIDKIPEDQLMDKFKRITQQASKMSIPTIKTIKN